MFNLTTDYIKEQATKLKNYLRQDINHSDASEKNPNANHSKKSLISWGAVASEDEHIAINRYLLKEQLKKDFEDGEVLAEKFDEYLADHIIYIHDETSMQPYCGSVNMFGLLTDGTLKLGSIHPAPQSTRDFVEVFKDALTQLSSELAGAVATVEFPLYMTKFLMDDYGDITNDEVFESIKPEMDMLFKSVVYYANTPNMARNGQSIFWNISGFDRGYFESMFGDFYFPVGKFRKVSYEQFDRVQRYFLHWFNQERTKSLLTFPVYTASLLNKVNEKDEAVDVADEGYADFLCQEMSEGNSFFIYQSKTADSLASCCRLKNQLTSVDFSHSLGAGGISTGSVKVITLNINRIVQRGTDLPQLIDDVHKFLLAYRQFVVENYIDTHFLKIYDAGFLDITRQFLTIGINGMVESAEFKGIKPTPNPEYKKHVDSILGIIYEKNAAKRLETEVKFNTEFVPAENLGVKNAKWDKEDGLFSPRDCYNSYFYRVESNEVAPLAKFKLHGSTYTSRLDGGSALHLNLDELMSKKQARALMKVAAVEGCDYWTYNVPVTICMDCGHINKHTLDHCSECNSPNVKYATRVIGYLVPIPNFSLGRRHEASMRCYPRLALMMKVKAVNDQYSKNEKMAS